MLCQMFSYNSKPTTPWKQTPLLFVGSILLGNQSVVAVGVGVALAVQLLRFLALAAGCRGRVDIPEAVGVLDCHGEARLQRRIGSALGRHRSHKRRAVDETLCRVLGNVALPASLACNFSILESQNFGRARPAHGTRAVWVAAVDGEDGSQR
ncbi:uncharacterized protein BKA78DRAFT_305461 [Phyllosticta capitalensis]|uniref:uncharacterized protein n=1 Tax=Phyllosticta capitalensis TaxID=121624 RepID=UPI0031302862